MEHTSRWRGLSGRGCPWQDGHWGLWYPTSRKPCLLAFVCLCSCCPPWIGLAWVTSRIWQNEEGWSFWGSLLNDIVGPTSLSWFLLWEKPAALLWGHSRNPCVVRNPGFLPAAHTNLPATWGAVLESELPAPGKPSDDGSPTWPLDYPPRRDPLPRTTQLSTPKFLISSISKIINIHYCSKLSSELLCYVVRTNTS